MINSSSKINILTSSISPHSKITTECSPSWFTQTKIKQIAVYSFAALALIGASILVSLAIAGLFISPTVFAFSAIFPICLACGLIYYGATRLDYEDLKQLAEMKEKAKFLDFQDLYNQHGAQNLVKYIFNEPKTRLSLDALKAKFKNEVHSGVNFEELNRRYDLSELENLGIAPSRLVQYIQKLQRKINAARASYTQEAFRIHRAYSARRENVRFQIREVTDQVNWAYPVLNLGRTDPFRTRDQVVFKACTSAIAGMVNFSIGFSNEAERQQHAYDDELSEARSNRTKTHKELHAEYRNHYHEYLD